MEVRIDKYLWAIRAFKTRTEAADACKGGKVKVDGVSAKASRDVKAEKSSKSAKAPWSIPTA